MDGDGCHSGGVVGGAFGAEATLAQGSWNGSAFDFNTKMIECRFAGE